MLKYKNSFAIIFALILISVPVYSMAVGGDFQAQPVSAPPTQGLPTNLGQLISQIFTWSLGILGISVFVIFFYSGFLWLTAAGNTSKIGEAKTHMTNAVFGAILLLSSYLILYTINPDFVSSTVNLPGLKTVPPSVIAPPSGGGACSFLLTAGASSKKEKVKQAMDAVLPTWTSSTDISGFKMAVVNWLNTNGEEATAGWNGNCNSSANNLSIKTGPTTGEMYEVAREGLGCKDEPNPTMAQSTPCRPGDGYSGPWSFLSTGTRP